MAFVLSADCITKHLNHKKSANDTNHPDNGALAEKNHRTDTATVTSHRNTHTKGRIKACDPVTAISR